MPKVTRSRPSTPSTGGGAANTSSMTTRSKSDEFPSSAPTTTTLGSFASSTPSEASTGTITSMIGSNTTNPSPSMLWFPPSTRSSFQFNNWPPSLSTGDPMSLGSLGSLSQRQSVDESSGVFANLGDPLDSLNSSHFGSSASSTTAASAGNSSSSSSSTSSASAAAPSAASSTSNGAGSSSSNFSQGVPIHVHQNHHHTNHHNSGNMMGGVSGQSSSTTSSAIGSSTLPQSGSSSSSGPSSGSASFGSSSSTFGLHHPPPSMLSHGSTHHGSGSISGHPGPFLGIPFFSSGDPGQGVPSSVGQGGGRPQSGSASSLGAFLGSSGGLPSDVFSSSNNSGGILINESGELDHIGGEPRSRTWSWGGGPPSHPGLPPQYSPAHASGHPHIPHHHHHRVSGQAGIEGMPPHFTPFPYYYPMEQLHPFARPSGSISGASTRSDITEESPREEDPTSDTTAYATREEDEGGEEENSDLDSYDEEDDEEDSSVVGKRRHGTRYRRSGGTRARIADDGGGSSALHSRHHRGTGRKKIDIQLIPTKLKRQITFSKRKTGLLKKVRELTTLTGTEAFVVLVSETGNPHTFATKKFQDLIRSHNMKELNSYLDAEEKRKQKGGSRHR